MQFDFLLDVLYDSVQLLHVCVFVGVLPEVSFMSFIYDKCSREDKVQLWDELRDIIDFIVGKSLDGLR